MKMISTSRFFNLLVIAIVCNATANAQFVGIGTATPDYKLHVAGNTAAILKLENVSTLDINIPTDMYFKTGTHYTGAIKTIGTGTNSARLGLFTYAATNQTQLVERLSISDNGNIGIGTNAPLMLFDVNGRMRIRHNNGATAGIAFTESTGNTNRGFVGMFNDNLIGLYGYNGGGWGLMMSTATGDVFIDSKLEVSGNEFVAGDFETNSSDDDAIAVQGRADFSAGRGTGVVGIGGRVGVEATAGKPGIGSRYGIWVFSGNGDGNNYGVYASGNGGNNAYGIYATASSGTNTWGGYFSGSVYTTGSYQGSDRKLKENIQPLQNAVPLIQALKPATYSYQSRSYEQMHLPQGQQYGLIADEVKEVFPGLVKKAVQPAQYENDDPKSGRVIAEEVSFDAVNYTALIPVLIGAIQEQQAQIDELQQLVATLKK